MAKQTVLEIVQDILSGLNDDEVNSISDTIESEQVAQILKTVFFEFMANKNWPHLRQLGTLEASGTTDRPTHMKVPELIKELEWIEYNRRSEEEPARNRYEKIKYIAPDQFLYKVSMYDNTQTNIEVVTDISGVELHIKNDTQPEFWTTFDDDYVVFNAYNINLEATLQESKCRISAIYEPSWTMLDGFIPDIPAEAFPAFLAEARSVCFAWIKQAPDQKAEQQSTRQRNWLSRQAWRVKGGIVLPAYARRTKK